MDNDHSEAGMVVHAGARSEPVGFSDAGGGRGEFSEFTDKLFT